MTYLELYLILKEEDLFDEFILYMQKNVLIKVHFYFFINFNISNVFNKSSIE